MGYPQVSFGGLFRRLGDPTSFVSRDNKSYELYDNVMIDRGNHHVKFGGYLFHLRFNPVNPPNARGNFAFNGQWTATRFADFLLGIPTVRRSASAAPTSTDAAVASCLRAGRLEDRSNLTFNYGSALRDQQPDGRCRQSPLVDRPARTGDS